MPLLCAVVLVFMSVLGAGDAAAKQRWVWPLEGELARGFDVSQQHFAAGQHRGVDIAAAVGSRVVSACSGRVRFVGRVANSGLTLTVACGDYLASYLHLSSVLVGEGQRVTAGIPVAASGRSGAPKGTAHLHLGVRLAGEYVNPLPLLERRFEAPREDPFPVRLVPAGRLLSEAPVRAGRAREFQRQRSWRRVGVADQQLPTADPGGFRLPLPAKFGFMLLLMLISAPLIKLMRGFSPVGRIHLDSFMRSVRSGNERQ